MTCMSEVWTLVVAFEREQSVGLTKHITFAPSVAWLSAMSHSTAAFKGVPC